MRLSKYILSIAGLISTIGFITGLGAAQPQDRLTGVWATADSHSWVLFEQCGESICGKIVGVNPNLASDGSTLHDSRNPDLRRRDLLICGLEILRVRWNEEQDTWEGSIYDPDSGKTYSSVLFILPSGGLHLRGFITHFPIFGRTEIWSRYQGSLHSECRMFE